MDKRRGGNSRLMDELMKRTWLGLYSCPNARKKKIMAMGRAERDEAEIGGWM